jgi:hypothetical protein
VKKLPTSFHKLLHLLPNLQSFQFQIFSVKFKALSSKLFIQHQSFSPSILESFRRIFRSEAFLCTFIYMFLRLVIKIP